MKSTTISSTVVHENPFYRVVRDEYTRPNGQIATHYVTEFPGAALIICIRDQEILTVTQYRYPVDATVLELPVGRIEAGEETAEAAKRELKEETGYGCKQITYLGKLWSLNGATNTPLYVYLVEPSNDVGEQDLDQQEDGLTAKWMPIQEWRAAIASGAVSDCESMAAWALYCETLASKNKA
jgi:ADP-ribose pyrophosphatase